jgi:hypothetical protein
MRLAGLLIMLTSVSPATAAPEVPTEDRSALALTLYGDGIGFVRDQREVAVEAGTRRVAFVGVSRQLIGDSVALRPSGSATVLDVAYRLDVLSPESLFRRALGREVDVIRIHPTTGEDTVEPALVLGVEGGLVLRYRDRIETGVPGRVAFRDVPADLQPQPALLATVDSPAAGRQAMTLTYLTQGLSWQADYVAVLDKAETTLALDGRATLFNSTGTDFPDADIALVAGSINRVPIPGPLSEARMDVRAMAAAAAPAPMPAREEFSALHLYRIGRRVSLADRESRQIALLAKGGIKIERDYVSENSVGGYGPARGEPMPSHPEIRIRFTNGERNGAGAPLPAGVVRLYGEDTGGGIRLLGEDRIDHTPLGGPVVLRPGRAFDLSVLRRQTDFARVGQGDRLFEMGWTITVSNARDQAAPVTLVEVLPGDWKILSETRPHEKDTADRVSWRLTVPGKGTVDLTYRVRIQM